MIKFNKVFLDTVPLIYFLDADVKFGEKTKSILEEILSSGKSLVSSTITYKEYLSYPYRLGNQEKIDVFFEFSKAYGVDFVPLSPEIIKLAIRFTDGYYKFNTADYLQLAVADHTGCDLFLTNDKELERFERLRCVTIEDWKLS